MIHKIEYFVGLISHIRSKLVDFFFFFSFNKYCLKRRGGGMRDLETIDIIISFYHKQIKDYCYTYFIFRGWERKSFFLRCIKV